MGNIRLVGDHGALGVILGTLALGELLSWEKLLVLCCSNSLHFIAVAVVIAFVILGP